MPCEIINQRIPMEQNIIPIVKASGMTSPRQIPVRASMTRQFTSLILFISRKSLENVFILCALHINIIVKTPMRPLPKNGTTITCFLNSKGLFLMYAMLVNNNCSNNQIWKYWTEQPQHFSKQIFLPLPLIAFRDAMSETRNKICRVHTW